MLPSIDWYLLSTILVLLITGIVYGHLRKVLLSIQTFIETPTIETWSDVIVARVFVYFSLL